MPCYEPRDSRNYGFMHTESSELERLEKRCATLTKLLCAAGRARLNEAAPPDAVLKWWEEHRKHDEETGNPWISS